MNLEELINKDIKLCQFNNEFKEYVKSCGLSKIKKRDLDKIIERFGVTVFHAIEFSQVYNLIATDETNRVMQVWTRTIGYLTIAIALMTLIMLYISIRNMN